jgi:hypothetical protein
LFDSILESRGLTAFERRGEYRWFKPRTSGLEKQYNTNYGKRDIWDIDERDRQILEDRHIFDNINLDDDKRDTWNIDKRNLQALEDRDIFDIEEKDLPYQEKGTLQKRAAHPFVMQGPAVYANFPANTLTTYGLGGCWVVAIVGKSGGWATHIPHGELAPPGPGGTVRQAVTSNQQATYQVITLLMDYHHHGGIPGAMGYILKHSMADPESTDTITDLLTGAGLSLKTATYSTATQGNGDLEISGDGQHDPVMKLGGHPVIL